MRPTLPLALLVSSLAGCGSAEPVAPPSVTSPAPSTTSTATAASPISPPPSTPSTPASPTAASTASAASSPSTPEPVPARRPRGPRLSAADRAAVAESLREGRRLTQDGQHREALARFESALAIAPSAWRVECETAFVAWRAEDAERADQHLERATQGIPPGFVPEAQRVPTAMCLFNGGLIHQARGRSDQARDFWEESIRLRPNATVSARLAALPPREDDTPAWQRLPASTPIDEIAAAMRAQFCADGLAGFRGGELEGCEELALRVQRVSDDPADLEAYRVSARFGVEIAPGEQSYEALVVRAGEVMYARVLAHSYNAELAYSNTEIEVEMALESALPGGRDELVVRVSDWGGSTSSEGEEGGTSRRVIVCSTDAGPLQCFSLHLAEWYSFIPMDYEQEDTDQVEGYCQDLSFADGRASFTRCQDFRGNEPSFIDGSHEVRALLERGDIRWPDVWRPLEPVGS